MIKLSSIEPLSVKEKLSPFDAFLTCVGYESRSIYAAQRLQPEATSRVACAFHDRHVGAFDKNYAWYKETEFDIEEVDESSVVDWTAQWLEGVFNNSKEREVRICVDISSMSRRRLASVLSAVMGVKMEMSCSVSFLYSVARWCPPTESPEPIVEAGAVLPFFAGWSSRPDLPVVALVGLGYEPDKAVGAYEYLEASDVWVFIPLSDELKYSNDVERGNRSLLSKVPEAQKITYRVEQPVRCFGTIESIVFGALRHARPILLPFGPKIFALCSMLVACLHRDVPVWRISSGQQGAPIEREANGQIIGIRAHFRSYSDTDIVSSAP